jgi:hypothetical protein
MSNTEGPMLFQSVYFTGNNEPDVSDIMYMADFYCYLHNVYDWNYRDFWRMVKVCRDERPHVMHASDITEEWLDSLEPGDKHYIFVGNYQERFWYIKVFELEESECPKESKP